MEYLTRADQVLIDQIILSDVRIINILDFEKLLTDGIVQMNTSKMQYYTASGQHFSSLHVADDMVTDFVAKAVKKDGAVCQYSTLIVSVKPKGNYGNLCCDNYMECYKHLVEIRDYLLSEYGIEVSIDTARIKSIEINKTFPLDDSFTKYRRVLSYLMNHISQYFKNQMDYHTRQKEYSSYYATTKRKRDSKAYLELKIYDKTKGLKIQVDNDYMRVELTFVGANKVKKSFGTNSFVDLNDQLISSVYEKFIKKYVRIPLADAEKKRTDGLLSIMKDERKKDIGNWITKSLRRIMNTEIDEAVPLLLDIRELFPLFDELTENGKPLSSSRKYEIRKSFIRHSDSYETAFSKHDDDKLKEVLEKI